MAEGGEKAGAGREGGTCVPRPSVHRPSFQFPISLKDRKQVVVVGCSTTSCLSVLSGVPQGSIVSPTLFVRNKMKFHPP